MQGAPPRGAREALGGGTEWQKTPVPVIFEVGVETGRAVSLHAEREVWNSALNCRPFVGTWFPDVSLPFPNLQAKRGGQGVNPELFFNECLLRDRLLHKRVTSDRLGGQGGAMQTREVERPSKCPGVR